MNTLSQIALAIHATGGAVGLLTGLVALFTRKGSPLHRKAGSIFVASMLVMAVFACYLAVVIPGQLINVFISIFALYMVTTAWLTVRRGSAGIGLPEKFAAIVGLCLCAPFAILSVQLAMGWTPIIHSSIALKGPVLIALYAFTGILGMAALGDALLVLHGGISGASRISRHLWRMCVGLTMALGSGFTNGLARLLPGPYHVPASFFLPQFIPLILMLFWLIRVRLPGWRRPAADLG